MAPRASCRGAGDCLAGRLVCPRPASAVYSASPAAAAFPAAFAAVPSAGARARTAAADSSVSAPPATVSAPSRAATAGASGAAGAIDASAKSGVRSASSAALYSSAGPDPCTPGVRSPEQPADLSGAAVRGPQHTPPELQELSNAWKRASRTPGLVAERASKRTGPGPGKDAAQRSGVQ